MATFAKPWAASILSGRSQCSLDSLHVPLLWKFRSEGRFVAGEIRCSSSRSGRRRDHRHRSQYNYDPFTLRPSEEHLSFPLVSASQLSHSADRPREVRILTREFIHDSLYNPHYGYFARQAILLPDTTTAQEVSSQGPSQPYAFSALNSDADFMAAVESRYIAFEAQFPAGDQHSSSSRPALNPGKSTPAPYSAEGLASARLKGRQMQQQQASPISSSMSSDAGVGENDLRAMAARQVWHTPTELFKPWYARAVARYIVAEYKLHLYPYHDLLIFEIGAGSGSLAEDILSYLQDNEPEIFARTQYRIVEISARLAKLQKQRLSRFNNAQSRVPRVHVTQKDVLQWETVVVQPCFFVALEVLDNMAHDVIRYSTADLRPYQGLISIDATGDMHELWEPVSDPLIIRYLGALQRAHSHDSQFNPVSIPRWLQMLPGSVRQLLQQHAPFYPNMTKPHYLPTNTFRLLEVLKEYFPQHRLVASDFHSLPEAVDGIDAPVVQTRVQGQMVPVTTYAVHQGWFDIFFPTNFGTLRAIYNTVVRRVASPVCLSDYQGTVPRTIAGQMQADSTMLSRSGAVLPAGSPQIDFFSRSPLPALQGARVVRHSTFLQEYAETEHTQLKNGSNPMTSWYANASWFLT